LFIQRFIRSGWIGLILLGAAAAQAAEPTVTLLPSSTRLLPRADTGWYGNNPLELRVRLRCPAGGEDCPFPFTISIRASDGARFYFLEEKLGGPAVPVECDSDIAGSDYSHTQYLAGCIREGAATALTLFAGELKTLRFVLWVQPSGAGSIDFDVAWGEIREAARVSVEPARVNPAVFVHGILGSMPPGNSVVDRWPQFQGDFPDFSLGPHLDPFTGSYKPLIDTLLRMGYEIDRSLFPVTYDWRQSNLRSAAWLREVLSNRVGANGTSVLCEEGVPYVNCEGRADVVVHSMGGLILRTYVAGLANWGDPAAGGNLDYQGNVDKAVFIASPHRGFPFDYTTLHGMTWKDYMDNQVPEEVPAGELLLPALDGILWPHLVMCQYRAEEGQPCDDPLADVFFPSGCPAQVLYDYSRADPFDELHPGIGSLREMIPEKNANRLPPRNYLSPTTFGKEENYLLDTLGLNRWQHLRSLRQLGDRPGRFDGIYVIFNSDQPTVQRYRVDPPPALPASVPGFPDYIPVHRRWFPGGEVPDPTTNPGIANNRGDGLIPTWSTRLFAGGLLDGLLPEGARLADHELRIDGSDHVMIMASRQTQAVVGAILTGIERPGRVRGNPELFPLHSMYEPPLVLLNNADVFLSLLGCPGDADAPLETLTVPSDGIPVTTTRTYASDKTYRIEVSGTYQWGICDSFNCPGGQSCEFRRFGDAEHLTDDCWASTFSDFFGTDISVFVDGGNVDWGPFNADHVYSIERAGNDGPFSFHIFDCAPCYGDNEGGLTVKIFEQ